MMPPQVVVVQNKSRRIKFSGFGIAEVTSQRPHASRWATLALYRMCLQDGTPCDDPSYVFTRIGHSRVYHQAECSDIRHHLPFGHEIPPTEEPQADSLIPCRMCAPESPPTSASSIDDFWTTHRFEVTKHFAAIVKNADALVDLLASDSARPRVESRQRLRMPWLSMALLDEAAITDSSIAEAYALDLRALSNSDLSATSSGGGGR